MSGGPYLYAPAMPVPPLTSTFVESFVLTCLDRGLTKEATADLLRLHAVSAAFAMPGFAAGFDQTLKEAAVRGLTKEAAGNLGKMVGGGIGLIGSMFKGVGSGARAVGRGAKAAPAVATGLAGVGLGAGIVGLNQMRTPAAPAADAPSIGVYDKTRAEAGEKAKQKDLATGTNELNKRIGVDGRRKAELQAVIDSNGPGAASAIAELQRLRGDAAKGQRTTYSKELQSHATATGTALEQSQRKLTDVQGARGSWMTKLRNFVGMPRDIDGEERALVGETSRLAEQNRIAVETRRRLDRGVVSGDPHEIIAPQDLQSRFFPTR